MLILSSVSTINDNYLTVLPTELNNLQPLVSLGDTDYSFATDNYLDCAYLTELIPSVTADWCSTQLCLTAPFNPVALLDISMQRARTKAARPESPRAAWKKGSA